MKQYCITFRSFERDNEPTNVRTTTGNNTDTSQINNDGIDDILLNTTENIADTLTNTTENITDTLPKTTETIDDTPLNTNENLSYENGGLFVWRSDGSEGSYSKKQWNCDVIGTEQVTFAVNVASGCILELGHNARCSAYQ